MKRIHSSMKSYRQYCASSRDSNIPGRSLTIFSSSGIGAGLPPNMNVVKLRRMYMGTKCRVIISISVFVDPVGFLFNWLRICLPFSRWFSESTSLLCMNSMQTKRRHVSNGLSGLTSASVMRPSIQAIALLYCCRANDCLSEPSATDDDLSCNMSS